MPHRTENDTNMSHTEFSSSGRPKPRKSVVHRTSAVCINDNVRMNSIVFITRPTLNIAWPHRAAKEKTHTATELSENGLLHPTYVGGATGTTGPAVGPATGSGDVGAGVGVVEADEVIGGGVLGGAGTWS